MKRRNFVYGSAALAGGALLVGNDAFAQSSPTAPLVRTNPLLEGYGGSEPIRCQSVVFDGERFLCLYARSTGKTRIFAVTASDRTGSHLWTHPLPAGNYLGLGKMGDKILVCSLHYFVSTDKAIPYSLLTLDPSTGASSAMGAMDNPTQPCTAPQFAGDSLLFRISGGQGEIWNVKNVAVVKQTAGINGRAISGQDPLSDLVTPQELAVVSGEGSYVSRITLPSGTTNEKSISDATISASRSYYSDLFAKQNIDPAKSRAAVLSAVGGDGDGNLYALLSPYSADGVAQVLKIGQDGNVTKVCTIQIPLNSASKVAVPFKLVWSQNQLGVVTYGGLVAWYQV